MSNAIGRIPVINVTPRLDEHDLHPRAFVGEVIPFEATSFREGHDASGVTLHLTLPNGTTKRYGMVSLGPGIDRWGVKVQMTAEGTHSFRVEGYSDDFATWEHSAEIKVPAGIDVELMMTLGKQLFAGAADDKNRRSADRKALAAIAKRLADTSVDALTRLYEATSDDVHALLADNPISSLSTFTEPHTLIVERTLAGRASWYEFFPRSEGAKKNADGSWTSGTFKTAAMRLPAVAEMGFDVLYMPPIHPIGVTNRKGPNNTLTPGPHDPGSPWAIGSDAGGHDAIHPDLGTFKDFDAFVTEAKKNGLEVALDLALQASPDHPWATEHREWFTTLPDGTIAYAENPPKKYQDIYPVNFDNDPEGIRAEMLRIVKLWISHGVKIFRVDNPHTKPVDFWQWLIETVNAESPDVIFLAEAFTRPAMMQTLAKVGFQQSYSYFTWRNTKAELTEFLTSVSTETAAFMRPNLFVNTPDILTAYLQFGGPAAFKIRAAIATTAAPLWGMYAGFELCESVARPGAEENIDSEKYEYKHRDWLGAEMAGTSLSPYITKLNSIRAEHPSLGQLRNIAFHRTDDDAILCYSKHIDGEFTGSGEADTIIVVANTDPHAIRETTVHLDMPALAMGWDDNFVVRDLINGAEYDWRVNNYVRLDPHEHPVHVFAVERR
jgi:starch synthase (maltosyl-transferring)